MVAIIETIARAADGETLFVEQFADVAYQQDFVVLVIAPVTAALDGFELGELLFPIPQHMGFYAAQFADFADGKVAFRGDGGELEIRLVGFHDKTFPP